MTICLFTIKVAYDDTVKQNPNAFEYEDDDGNQIPLPVEYIAEHLLEDLECNNDADLKNGYGINGLTFVGWEILNPDADAEQPPPS